jgi:hypothetical protein
MKTLRSIPQILTKQRIILLLGLFALLGANHSPAQGRINFGNNSTTPLRITTWEGTPNVILGTASTAYFGIGPASVRIHLFAGLTSTTLSPVSIGTCSCLPYVTNYAGTIASAQGTFPGGNNLQLAGFDGSAPVFLQFTATSINGNLYGMSPIIQVNLATGAAPSTSVFSSTPSASTWNGLTLVTTVQLPPAIQTPPQSQSVAVGSAVTLSVQATGTPLNYQWRKDGENIGANSANLHFANVSADDAGAYDVRVFNILGAEMSSSAVLQVLPTNAPSISINGQLALATVSVVSPADTSITGGFAGGIIFYTLDGSAPTIGSTLYAGPFSLTSSATIRAMSLSADFSQTAEAPAVNLIVVPTYPLATAVVGSGAINVNPALGPYPSNSIVTLTTAADSHWTFAHWTGDLTGNANPANVTMNGPRSVQAVFAQSEFPLTVSSPGGGSVTANGESIAANTYYPTGTVVSLAAVPVAGWSFLHWLGGASGSANPLAVAMTQTQNVQAVFGTTISSNVSGGGSIQLSIPNPVPFGVTVNATALPAPGYYFVTWTGALTGTNNPANFSVTSATPTVGALFAPAPAPTIVTTPAHTNVVIGQPASFSVTATGAAPLSYQWRQAGIPISNATNAVHFLATTTTNDAGAYDVIVMNGVGGSVTSSIATLTLLFPPAISQSPQSAFVVNGSNAVFSVVAGGTAPLSYQWRKDGSPLAGGATNLTLTSVTTNDNGGYQVVVSNPYGSATSSIAMLTVVFPPSILAPPSNQTVATGSPLQLEALATGTEPLSYQWQHNGAALAAATNANYELASVQLTNAGNYVVVVSNPYGSATSSVAAVTVFVPVMFTIHPATQVVPLGGLVEFGAEAVGVPTPEFQWLFDGNPIPGATAPSLVLTNISTNALGNYSVIAWNEFSVATSSVASLYLSPSLRAPFLGATVVWGKEAILSVWAVGSGALNYQWYQDGVPVLAATNATLVFPSVQVTNGGLYSVVVTSEFGSVTNPPAQLVINPANVSLGFYAGITIDGVPGYTYGIEFSTNLADVNAWNFVTNVTLLQPVELWIDTSVKALGPGNNGRYYRVTAP